MVAFKPFFKEDIVVFLSGQVYKLHHFRTEAAESILSSILFGSNVGSPHY